MNAGAIALGKKVCPSRKVTVAGGIWLTTEASCGRDRIDCIGLYPRKAENRALVGEIEVKALASCGTPALIIAAESALGRLLDSPVITTVKKTAMLTVCPVFLSV